MYPNADSEWFWALYAPFGVVFLFTRENYRFGITQTVLQQLVAAPCLIVAMAFSFWQMFRRQKTPKVSL